MFQDNIFEKWLDNQANVIIDKLGAGLALSSEEMIVLVLKAQTNHFAHLDEDLRKDMRDLREDLTTDMRNLREDMDKRFEQVDKRFEQVDKRFDSLIGRMDRFMVWSLGLTLTSTMLIIGFIFKFAH